MRHTTCLSLSSLQDSFWDRIQRVRNAELAILWKTFVIDSTNVFLLNAIPTVVSVATFATYILMGNNLTAAKVNFVVVMVCCCSTPPSCLSLPSSPPPKS